MLSVGITLNPAMIAAGASLSGPGVAWRADAGRNLDAGGVDHGAPDVSGQPGRGMTWQELYDGAGNEVTITAAAGQFVIPLLDPSYLWRGVNMLQVRSGTLAAPVNQVAAAVVNIVTRSEML